MLFFVFFFPEKDDVDFENSRLGMWGNSNTDNLNWNFNRGFTSTIHTGPDKDHTNGQGQLYVYLRHLYKVKVKVIKLIRSKCNGTKKISCLVAFL